MTNGAAVVNRYGPGASPLGLLRSHCNRSTNT